MNPHALLYVENPPAKPTGHRRGVSWLMSAGADTIGKKGKRIIHRRERHTVRTALKTISI